MIIKMELRRRAKHCTAPGKSVYVCFRAGVTVSFLISAYGLFGMALIAIKAFGNSLCYDDDETPPERDCRPRPMVLRLSYRTVMIYARRYTTALY